MLEALVWVCVILFLVGVMVQRFVRIVVIGLRSVHTVIETSWALKQVWRRTWGRRSRRSITSSHGRA